MAEGATSERHGPVRRVALGLGSNVGDRAGHLTAAVEAWGDEVEVVSDVYETAPVGGPDQGPFLNLVLVLRTDLAARAVLARSQALETAAQRRRTVRWGPRTLDVDILWIDDERHDEPDLVVPHPRMGERAFVTVPLAEVAPDLVPPGEADPDQEVRRIGPLASVPGTGDGSGGRGRG